jgi:hypothetical protein
MEDELMKGIAQISIEDNNENRGEFCNDYVVTIRLKQMFVIFRSCVADVDYYSHFMTPSSFASTDSKLHLFLIFLFLIHSENEQNNSYPSSNSMR